MKTLHKQALTSVAAVDPDGRFSIVWMDEVKRKRTEWTRKCRWDCGRKITMHRCTSTLLRGLALPKTRLKARLIPTLVSKKKWTLPMIRSLTQRSSPPLCVYLGPRSLIGRRRVTSLSSVPERLRGIARMAAWTGPDWTVRLGWWNTPKIGAFKVKMKRAKLAGEARERQGILARVHKTFLNLLHLVTAPRRLTGLSNAFFAAAAGTALVSGMKPVAYSFTK